MKKISIIGLISALALLWSCKDDLNVNAEWESIPVVYALFSQVDTVHYVKVNKAFLGEASAAEMASVSDSLFFSDVQVWVNKISNGNVVSRLDFLPVDDISKPEGYFANDRNTIYAWKGTIDASAGTSAFTYELNVYVPSSNVTCKSEIQLIDGVLITDPSVVRQISLTQYERGNVVAKYYTGKNGNLYQMTFRFYYIEINEETNDTIWDLPPVQISFSDDVNTTPSTEITKEFSVAQFYQLVSDNIPVKPGYRRYAKQPYPVEFTLCAADVNFKTYSEVSAPSSGIVQEKPFFTNITNGVGLFAARYRTTVSNKVTSASLDTLARGIYTKQLNFGPKTDEYYRDFY